MNSNLTLSLSSNTFNQNACGNHLTLSWLSILMTQNLSESKMFYITYGEFIVLLAIVVSKKYCSFRSYGRLQVLYFCRMCKCQIFKISKLMYITWSILSSPLLFKQMRLLYYIAANHLRVCDGGLYQCMFGGRIYFILFEVCILYISSIHQLKGLDILLNYFLALHYVKNHWKHH